jgi:hypothetical protein
MEGLAGAVDMGVEQAIAFPPRPSWIRCAA